MEISLHLGAHQTGTGALQNALTQNEEELRHHRIALWLPSVTRKGLFTDLLKNPRNARPVDDALCDRASNRIQMRLDGLAQQGVRQVIVSEENMLGTVTQNLQSRALYDQAVARSARFASAFAGHKLRIGLSIRSYDAFWAAALALKIQHGFGLPARRDLDRLADQPRRWYELIRNVARVFPQADIHVWSFEDLGQTERSPLGALVGRDLPIKTVSNPGPSNLLPSKRLAQLLRQEGDLIGAGRLSVMPDRFMPFSDAQRKAMKTDYRADLAWLRAGADGLATYLTPIGENPGGFVDIRGTHHDQEERRLVRAG